MSRIDALNDFIQRQTNFYSFNYGVKKPKIRLNLQDFLLKDQVT